MFHALPPLSLRVLNCRFCSRRRLHIFVYNSMCQIPPQSAGLVGLLIFLRRNPFGRYILPVFNGIEQNPPRCRLEGARSERSGRKI